MANFNSIAAAGKSLERLLTAAFADPPIPVPGKTTKAYLVRTEDFDRNAISTVIVRPALSIFLYRVDFNKTMRAAWSGVTAHDGIPHLPLDLHFLLTPWGDNAESEGAILGRAMQCRVFGRRNESRCFGPIFSERKHPGKRLKLRNSMRCQMSSSKHFFKTRQNRCFRLIRLGCLLRHPH